MHLTLPSAIEVTYTYDNSSLTTGIDYRRNGLSVGDVTYYHDHLGNRRVVTGSLVQGSLPNVATVPATHDAANQLTTWNGVAITYDANGNMLNDGTRTYTWGARGVRQSYV